MKYKWVRQIDGMPHVPAQVVGKELERLERSNEGALLPSTIVRAAKPKKSKLHPCFEWDDKKAANAHRENQAREILRKIVVVYDDENCEEQMIRAFVNIKTEEGSFYCHTSRIVQDMELQANVLEQILADLVSIKRKYAQYKSPQLQKIWDAVEELVLS